MKNQVEIINFKELRVSVPGEDLEGLTRQLAKKLRLNPIWTGRGPDGGRDLLLTESLSGSLSSEKMTWFVSCKDLANSGKSFQEADFPKPGIKDKLAQYKASGFLLVTTTTVSAGAKKLLDDLDKKNGGAINTLVWDSSELKSMLLEASNNDILKQYLPESYKRVQSLTSIESILEKLKPQMPEEIYLRIINLINPYIETSLYGVSIWPFDPDTANKIDEIVKWLIIEHDSPKALKMTEELDPDAFIAFIQRLNEKYPAECEKYLSIVATQHPDSDFRFNAAHFLFDNFEVNPPDALEIYGKLNSDDLYELLGSEVIDFVNYELTANTPNYYELHNAIDQLSSRTTVDDVQIESLKFQNLEKGAIHFSGEYSLSVLLEYDHEEMGGFSFPGNFSGYFDINGIFIETANVDTIKFYE
ncbi:MAG: hypothetical protein V3W18_00455 [candidate division Zixibacteria bacterium]